MAAVAVGSGQAASAMCIQNLAQSGDNVVASTDLYGSTANLFKYFKTTRYRSKVYRSCRSKNFEKHR